MQFSQLLSVLANIIQLNSKDRDIQKPFLRNYPHCGELGREENKECFWDCKWQPIPDQVLQNYGPFSIPRFVESTECLRDCKSIQECLAIAQPIYDELNNSSETNGTVIF